MRTWMKFTLVILSLVIITGFIGLGSVYYYSTNFSKEDYETFNQEDWINPLENEGIVDNNSLYDLESDLKVEQIYVTVLNDTDKTFNEVILKNDREGDTETTLNIFFETDEKKILNNGLYIKEPNGTIRVKGKASQKSPQKSFKIELAGNAGLWKGQKVINLNKFYGDPLRIRSKLAFDYMSLIPNITSLQTSYVRLFIRDLSEGDNGAEFVDYGFYTQVEQPNNLYLKNHLLDENGHLYEAVDFDFSRNEGILMSKGDEGYSKKAFEEILDIKGSDDHRKLIEMVEAVNDESIDINWIIEKYFHEENYLTWLATCVLFDNYEAGDENYLLYSPLNSNKWFFMPWDMDNTFGTLKERPDWQWGPGMFFNNVLHKRYLSEDGNVEKLTAKIEELKYIVNSKTTSKLLDRYYEILMANITKLPDYRYLSMEFQALVEEYKKLPDTVETAELRYQETLNKPMPFNITDYTYENGNLNVQWEKAVHLLGHNVTYDVEVSTTPDFSSVEYEVLDIQEENTVIQAIPSGTYYIKVTAKDSKGNTQYSYEKYEDGSNTKYFGVVKIRF